MPLTNLAQQVRNQYENYPYPLVDPEDEKRSLRVPITEAFDRLNHYCFSGRRDFRKSFRALVAGGGTGDAAVALAEQFRDHPAEIIYLDMSGASMDIAKKRASLRGLDNIRWLHESLMDIPALGLGQFDYINCSGVLHHLPDPDAGLKILADALKDDGAMGVMVYAKYGRLAVYQMQEALRLVNRGEDDMQARVENAKKLLNHLPGSNWFPHSPPVILSEVRAGDVGIYDLLLHSQDRAYSIPELYDYVEGAGLNIVRLFSDDKTIEGSLYNPAFYIKDPELAKKALTLPLKEQQALAELLNGKIAKHTFYAAKRVPAPPKPDDLEMIPLLGFDIFSEAAGIADVMKESGDIVLLRQSSTGVAVVLQKTPHMEMIMRQIDGRTALKDIFRKVMDSPSAKKSKPNFQTLAKEFSEMFAPMNARQWMFLRHKDTAPVLYVDVLQERVKTLHATGK